MILDILEGCLINLNNNRQRKMFDFKFLKFVNYSSIVYWKNFQNYLEPPPSR